MGAQHNDVKDGTSVKVSVETEATLTLCLDAGLQAAVGEELEGGQ
jgi:hypothetical protein